MSGLTKKLIAIAGASVFVSSASMAGDLTVVSWGGAYTKSQVEAYHKPWMAKTCLLYTSPSPRDKRQSRMPSSA